MKRSKARLTKRRAEWAAKQARQEFVGTLLPQNPAIAAAYAARLEREVRAARDVILREVATLYPSGVALDAAPGSKQQQAAQARILTNKLMARFIAHFARFAPGLAKVMMGRVNRSTKSQLHASLAKATGGMSLKMPPLTGDVEAVFKASVSANVSLIKSISGKYLEQVQDAVLRNMQQGGTGAQGVYEEINRLTVVAEKRAKLIAVDQVRKATSALNDARLKKLGVKRFRWVHSGGGKEPRKLHLEYDGRVFDLDNPPVIDERTGERGLPGQLINCRCRMAPIIEFEE